MDTISETLAGCRRLDIVVDDDALADLAEHDAWTVQGRHERRRTCTACCAGKKRYGEASARRAARVLNWAQGEDVHAYACPNGRHWHVGHQPVAAADPTPLDEREH